MSTFKSTVRILPDLVPGTNVRFGHEKTPGECRARARWEHEQYQTLKSQPFGAPLAAAHLNNANSYERLAKVREELLLKLPTTIPGTNTAFGAERTVEDFRARAQWERDRAQLLMGFAEGPSLGRASIHLNAARGYEAAAGQVEIDALASYQADYGYDVDLPSL